MLKFLRTFAMAAAMMLPFAMQAQQSWTVADGTTTHALVPLDFYNCDGSGNRQAQMLYPASLLTEMDGATIGTVKLYHQNTGSKTVTASTWYLRMGETSEADLSSGFSSETLTTVYSGNLVITGGVMTFELTTPYTYNGGNLIVEIQTSGASGNWFGSGSQGCYGVDNAGSTYSTMSSPNYTAFVPKATFTEAPSCFPVTGLAIDATQTTSSSLTLTWSDANNSGASYDIYMVTPTDTTLLDNTTTTTYTATGLNANTAYVFGVVSNCSGGDMAQMVTVSGRTACDITPLPYSENFSGYTGLTSYPYYGPSVLPYCWGYYSNGTNTAETTGTSSYFGGVAQYSSTYSYGCIEANNPYLCMPIQVTGSAVTSSTYTGYEAARGNTKFAVLPAFEDALNTLQISFDYKMYNSYSATGCATTLELGYITTDTSSFVSMQQYQAVTSVQHVVELSLATLAADAPDGARLAFKFSGVHNGTETYSYTTDYCGIDNIVVEELPSCFHITDLAVSATTTTSISLTWADTVNSGATYSVYIVTPTDTTLVESGISGTTYTVENLDPNTQYVFSVVANCSASDASEGEMISGRTACTAIAIDSENNYTENFDSYTVSVSSSSAPSNYPNHEQPACWEFLNMSASSSAYPQAFMTGYSNYAVSGNCLFFKSSSTMPLYAILPDFEATTALQLQFSYRNEGVSDLNGTILVGVMFNASDATTFVALDSCAQTTTITPVEVNIPADVLEDGARVAFCYRGGTNNNYYAAIDNVVVREAPACLPVSGLTVSNVAARTATLTWSGDADGYTIYDMRDTSAYEYANDTTVVLYALDPVTAYTFGVAANCGSDESDMRTVSFTTTISCPAPTALDATLTPGDGTVATLSWHEAGEAAEWQICIDNDMENLIDVTDSVYEMTGLTAEQAITAKVRAICGEGDTSTWTAAITFTPTDAYSITVNDGTSTNDYVPIYGSWVDNHIKSQFIIPAADLSAMQWGSVNKLTFYASNANVPWTNASFEVYLTETEATGVSSLNAVSDMTQVYTGSLSIVNNKMEVTFATPYTYMGGNLLVAFEQPTSGTWGASNWYGVSATGASMGGYGTTISQRNFLPKMTINYTPGEEPTCFPVSGLAASGITADEATLTWTGDASSYNVYSISGADTTLVENVSDATVTLTGLDAMTQYTYGVRAACGSDESDIRTVVFNTACGAVELPYTETFAAASATRDCWNLVSNNTANVGGNNGMGFVTTNGREVLQFSSYSQDNAGNYDQYGFSPLLNVSEDATNLQVTVVYGTNTNDNLYFGYVTANDTVWDSTPYNTGSGAYSTFNWQSQTFVIPATATQLAVHYYGNFSYYGRIDSVIVTEMTADYCFPVSDLTVDAAQTTTESITLNWVSDGSSFTVLNMADSSIIGTTTDTFMVINNLEASSRYTFGVVNNCGSGDSDTVTVEARTACAAFALPYTEDFENGIDCWSLESCASGTNVVEGTNYAYTGTHAFKFAYNTNPPQYLISPELTGGENGVQVSLMYKVGGSFTESFVLGYSTTTNETSAFTWLTEQTGLTNTTYEAYTDYLPAGTKYIAVKYTANNQLSLYIDSLVFSPMSANFCFPVTGLAVDTATGNSVTISWTGDAASYDVYNGTALVGSTTDTFYTVSGLTASTAYTFGVQAICSASDSSDMVTIAAMTDCEGGSCTITIVGTDEYGDGWDNSYIDIQQNGASVGQCTVEGDPWAYDDPYPVTETYTYTVCAGVPVTFTWVNGGGNYDDEASFIIKNGNDSVIYTASDASELTAGSVFYTANNVCGSDEPQPHPQVEEATIDASAVTYWVGTGNNQVVMAVNWADTALAWGVNFSTDSITSQDVLDIIAANDPRFSWDTGSYGLGNITFTENGTTHTGDATHFWESKRNTISDMGLYQNLGNGDFQKWANSAAGEVVDSMEYSGVWYYMYNYPMTIYPVTAPQPGPQPADSISVTYTVNDAVMGTITPNGTIRQAVGDSLIATATANDGYHLQGWRLTIMAGGQVASDTTFSIVQPSVFFGTIPQSFATYGASVTVTAIFEAGAPDSVEVTYNVNDATMGSINPSGTVMTAVGTQISATATANEGYELYAWVYTVMLDDQVVDSDTIMTNETSYVFGSLPQTFADYNATVIITALFQQQVGIEDADIDNVNVYSANSTIYVRGAEGQSVYVFDVNGRMLNHEAKASENCDFRMENTGVYLVKVGNAAAQRVLVVR
ncbi:MAG: fibronectin type III domain-containing protein [Bacteroidales bacterium]|nr:fibronectin type III domain-containing protein [Bacteroidales bacterium]